MGNYTHSRYRTSGAYALKLEAHGEGEGARIGVLHHVGKWGKVGVRRGRKSVV